jgi:hypothetical protein
MFMTVLNGFICQIRVVMRMMFAGVLVHVDMHQGLMHVLMGVGLLE